MRISVAMATYNGARFIREQLDSIAAQTLPPSEVVISDDGSTDRTAELVEAFAVQAPFAVRFARNPHRLGFSRNFEAAIARCEGDIIFLSDQDDAWFPDKVATVCVAFEDSRIFALLNGQIITDADLSHDNVTMLSNARAFGMGPGRLVSGCATALRRSWADLLLPMPPRADAYFEGGFLAYDRWINELSVALGVRRFLARPLQYFRRYGANTSQSIQHDPRGVGLRKLVAARASRAPAEAWLRRVEVLDLYVDWLDANTGRLRQLGIETVDDARATFKHERTSLEARALLARQARPRRLASILRLWRSGGYVYFYNWKSALRDLVRSAA